MPVSRAANSDSFTTTTPGDREIVLTRLFDAPVDLVFDVMTKCEHVKRWWGCLDEKHSMPVCEIDLSVGGKWRFVGRSPDGDYGFHGVYQEIAAPERLVYTEIYDPYPDAGSLVTQTLVEENGKTRLTVAAMYSSTDVRDMVIASGMAGGAAISYDRLEEEAASVAASRR